MVKKMAKTISPMMQRYLETKKEYSDCILFYRLGDFYEMFFDDAKTASRELEITLTGKDCGLDERAPMCGVPYHSVTAYIAKLIEKGYKVAICEQTEDPKQAKGLVKRDVVRVVTPGTLIEDEFLDEKSNNYLEIIYVSQRNAALVFCDISTSEIFAAEVKNVSEILNETARYSPREIIINSLGKAQPGKAIAQRFHIMPDFSRDEMFDDADAEKVVTEHFGKTAAELGLEGRERLVTAVAAMLRYLFHTQKSTVPYINSLNIYSASDYMDMDMATRRNLELTGTMRDNSRSGSLLGVLDKTRTSMGARLLRQWIEKPLLDVYEINRRLDGVDELADSYDMRESAKYVLDATYDISRILTRTASGTVTPKDMLALKSTLNDLPTLSELIKRAKSPILHGMKVEFDELRKLWLYLESAIDDKASSVIRDGGMIKKGHNRQVDDLRDIKQNSKKYLEAFESSERERTGIPKLKVGYNKVFGYYIDISKLQADNVPEDYIRRQTLANNERYTTEKLKEIESEILGASEKLLELELHLYGKAIKEILKYDEMLRQLAQVLSTLDCVYSLAEVAIRNSYTRPSVDNSGLIEITEGRHPVVEEMTDNGVFVPNNTLLDTEKNRLMLITGPNMAGKSTYMRQTALITLMAQIGSFVPAGEAHIGVVDRIFTRVGASDDIASGQSTFMLEMTEVANILKNATNRSLIILDEIGRGTSTFDGLSIAWAVAEYVHDKKHIGAKTLFATHYHEMTEMESNLEGVKNYNIAVKKKGDDITFLRKIVRGGADRSYGIEVAALAGVPKPVINAAKRILKRLEETTPQRDEPIFEQIELGFEEDYSSADYFVPGEDIPDEKPDHTRELKEIADELKKLNVTSMTIMDAANKLYELAEKAKKII